jgi:hypothetical protein
VGRPPPPRGDERLDVYHKRGLVVRARAPRGTLADSPGQVAGSTPVSDENDSA